MLRYIYINDVSLWLIFLNIAASLVVFIFNVFVSVNVIIDTKKYLIDIEIFNLDNNKVTL